jgi:hypothetical protein
MKWTHGDKELDEYLEHANNIHPSIKFTHEVSKTKMSFLDTTTMVKEGNMTTDLYSKPTDKHQYLSPSSCHPKHFLRVSLSAKPQLGQRFTFFNFFTMMTDNA